MLCTRCSHPLKPRADRCLRCFALNPQNFSTAAAGAAPTGATAPSAAPAAAFDEELAGAFDEALAPPSAGRIDFRIDSAPPAAYRRTGELTSGELDLRARARATLRTAGPQLGLSFPGDAAESPIDEAADEAFRATAPPGRTEPAFAADLAPLPSDELRSATPAHAPPPHAPPPHAAPAHANPAGSVPGVSAPVAAGEWVECEGLHWSDDDGSAASAAASIGAPLPAPEPVRHRERLPVPSVSCLLIAWSIDLSIVLGCAALLVAVAAALVGPAALAPAGPQPLDTWADLVLFGHRMPVLWATLAATVALAYSWIFMALGGQTPGMWSAGLQLVRLGRRATGQVSAARALARSLLALPSLGLGSFGFVLALVDARGQTLHDKLSGCALVAEHDGRCAGTPGRSSLAA